MLDHSDMKNRLPKRARGEGRVFRRGKVCWIQFYDHGLQIRESAGTEDEKKAGKILRKRLGEVAAGIQRDTRGLRYEDLRESYYSDLVSGSSKSLRFDADRKPYLEAVRRLDQFFEGYRAVEVDADQVRKFHLEEKQRGSSNGTINRSVACLRRMFTLAQRDGKMRTAPFFPMLPEAKPRRGTLAQDKYTALLAELPSYLRPVTAIGFRTGMRLGEILGLTWQNVNWLERIIRLEAGTTKNDEAREIPFRGELETVLKEQYAARQEGCDRVCFRIDRLGHARPVGNFRKAWRRACVKVGLGKWEPELDPKTGEPILERPRYKHSQPKPKMVYTGLIFHDLRRSFVTDAEHAGAPRHEVMAITGHKTESVYKRYAIENREQRRAALDHIDAYRSHKVQGQFGDNSASSEQDASVKH
jgi:integrase